MDDYLLEDLKYAFENRTHIPSSKEIELNGGNQDGKVN